MPPDEVDIIIITHFDRESVKKLYQQAGWWEENDQSPDGSAWIDDMVHGSFCFVGAFLGGEMIGMGRAISDGASDAYIQDVTVLREFRGRGIGQRIIRAISENLVSRGIGWIGLVAEPGTQEFYRRLGFEVLEGFSPMRLKKDRN
jgi:ribosomal protein S18 acetylase RimI-like enzyme